MTSYADWIKRDERSDGYIVILAPKEPFDPIDDAFTWTLDTDDTYWTTYPRNASEHWYVWEVYDNGTKPLPTSSLAACKAAQHKWFFDKAARRIYVHLTANANPNTHKVQVCPLLGFCSEVNPALDFTVLDIPSTINDGLAYTDVLFYPLLSDRGLSRVSTRLESAFFGVSLPSLGGCELVNEPEFYESLNGWMDKWGRRFLWRDTSVLVFHGDGGYELTFSEFRALGRHRIKAQPSVDDNTFVISFANDAVSLMRKIPTGRFTDLDFPSEPEIEENTIAEFKPILLGGHADMPAYRLNSTDYFCLDNPITAFTAVKQDGVVTAAYTDISTATETKIRFNSPVADTVVVTFSAHGYFDIDGNLGATAEYAGAAVRYILNTLGRVKLWKINTTALAAYDAGYPVPLSVYIGGPLGQQSIMEVLEILMQSVMARLVQDEDGKYTLTKYDPAAASVATIHEDEIFSIREHGEGVQVANEIMLKYAWQFPTSEFHIRRSESLLAGTNYEGTSTQIINANYLIEPPHAQNACDTYLLIHEQDCRLIEVRATGEIFNAEVGEKVTLIRSRGFEADGDYSEDYLIRAIDKDTSQAPGVATCVLEDVSGDVTDGFVSDLTSSAVTAPVQGGAAQVQSQPIMVMRRMQEQAIPAESMKSQIFTGA